MVRVDNHKLFRMTCIVKTSTYHKSKKGFCVKNKILFRQLYDSTAYLLLIPRLVDMQKILILLAFYFQCPLSLPSISLHVFDCVSGYNILIIQKVNIIQFLLQLLLINFLCFKRRICCTFLILNRFFIALHYANCQTQNLSMSNMMQ